MIYYRGGKKTVAKTIIRHLPPGEIFYDVFGGAASIAIEAVKSGKYNQVVYNDLDQYLVNFMEQVRDKPADLIRYIDQTPLGRHIDRNLAQMIKSDNKIVSAAGVFYACNYQGKPVAAQKNAWMRPRIRSRNNVDKGTRDLVTKISQIQDSTKHLRRVYLENLPAEKFIDAAMKPARKYQLENGNINMVFFFDPPYGKTQDYRVEFNSIRKIIDLFRLSEWTIVLCCERGQFTQLENFDWLNFVGKKGTPIGSFSRKTIEQGMHIKYRAGFEPQTQLLHGEQEPL